MSKPTLHLDINKFYKLHELFVTIRDYIDCELEHSNIKVENVVFFSKTDDIIKQVFKVEFKYDFSISEYDQKNQEWHDIKHKKRKITESRHKKILKQVALFKLQLS